MLEPVTVFKCNDQDSLIVLIRYADSIGSKIVRVAPVNDRFVAYVTGDVEVTNQTDLGPFTSGSNRSYWEDIVEVPAMSAEFIGI